MTFKDNNIIPVEVDYSQNELFEEMVEYRTTFHSFYPLGELFYNLADSLYSF